MNTEKTEKLFCFFHDQDTELEGVEENFACKKCGTTYFSILNEQNRLIRIEVDEEGASTYGGA